MHAHIVLSVSAPVKIKVNIAIPYKELLLNKSCIIRKHAIIYNHYSYIASSYSTVNSLFFWAV